MLSQTDLLASAKPAPALELLWPPNVRSLGFWNDERLHVPVNVAIPEHRDP